MNYKQVDEDGYDEVVSNGLEVFQNLLAAYFAGLITLSVLRERFNQALEIYFVQLMILGLGEREPTQQDLDFLRRKIDEHQQLFEGFAADLAAGSITENRALWRAGLYATDRTAFIYYTIPNEIALLMPGLPGDICLGNGLCGCHLEVQYDDEGNAAVYWIINPEKESCAVCLDMEAQSPFLFNREDLFG